MDKLASKTNDIEATDVTELIDGVLLRCKKDFHGDDWRLTFISNRCEDVWGFTAAEIIADYELLSKCVDRRTCVRLTRSIQQALEAGKPWREEWVTKSRNGTPRWLRGVGRSKLEINGSALLTVVVTDITRSGRVDLIDASTLSNFRMLADRLEDVAIHRFGSDLKVTYWNATSARMYGYSANEAIGKNTLELVVSAEQRASWKKFFEDILIRRERFTSFEGWLSRNDGSLVEVRRSIVLMEFPDKPVEFVCLDYDQTARRSQELERAVLEEQLRQSQKLEALGTLAGGVAHDFNNILAAILGNTHLAISDSSDNEEVLKSLNEIKRAGHRAKDLVQRILSFSRRVPPSRTIVAMKDIVAESVELLRSTAPKTISISVFIDPETPAVFADPSQLHQVVLNLCTNAVQAINDRNGGHLTIKVGPYSMTPQMIAAPGELAVVTDPNGWPDVNVCLYVEDNGCGMDEATLTRLFEPFFTTKPVGAGTGLGMSVVHRILRDHQAAIFVSSKLGKGSIFRVLIRSAGLGSVPGSVEIEPAEELISVNVGSMPSSASLPTVLYVDDDELISKMIGRMLKKFNFPAHIYTESTKALGEVRSGKTRYDLAVLDYSMPILNGLELAKELLRLHPGKPVIITSGFISERLRREAPKAGVAKLIPKPNTGTQLLKTVERIAMQIAKERQAGAARS